MQITKQDSTRNSTRPQQSTSLPSGPSDRSDSSSRSTRPGHSGQSGQSSQSGLSRPAAADAAPKPSPRPAASSIRPPRQNAFSAHFLDVARRRAPSVALAESPLAVAAHGAGPFEVEWIPRGSSGDGVFAVVRRSEPARQGGGARLAFVRRQEALLAAAALSALAVPDRLSLNADKQSGRRSRLGFPLHDGGRHLGHASPALVAELRALRATAGQACCRPGAPFLDHYHGLRAMASTPAAVALFVEALDPETLALVGREIMRRLAPGG